MEEATNPELTSQEATNPELEETATDTEQTKDSLDSFFEVKEDKSSKKQKQDIFAEKVIDKVTDEILNGDVESVDDLPEAKQFAFIEAQARVKTIQKAHSMQVDNNSDINKKIADLESRFIEKNESNEKAKALEILEGFTDEYDISQDVINVEIKNIYNENYSAGFSPERSMRKAIAEYKDSNFQSLEERGKQKVYGRIPMGATRKSSGVTSEEQKYMDSLPNIAR